MNSRERMIRAFEYTRPDRIPVVYHPSPAGLYVHGRKLLDLFNRYPPDNPVDFSSIHGPDPETLKGGEYDEIKEDEWGVVTRHRVFGIAGQVLRHPLADYAALEHYVMPEPPALDSPEARAERNEIERLREDYLVFRGGLFLFHMLLQLRPMDDVLVELYTEDERLMRLLDRLTENMRGRMEYMLYCGADVVMFVDDWGFQETPIISPERFRRIYRPRYERLFRRIHEAGRKVFFHSCGFLGPIFDELADMGIDGIWHQANRVDTRAFALKCREHGITAYLHPDRQHLMPFGSPDEIRAAVRTYADIYHELGGGGIFYVEIENDAPWENVKALVEAIDEYR
ncbi:uroporphyrinogen decarboxylase family protein [Kiritimatiella glycovorans]|uniref:Uroporphyrinogen decarboxylase (URO-D) domain-containing protein n=1 Tax=Kiritimatiella glycovorans TaxID=1307763 RepID=A0A0G3EHN1_9BACT|nr:uroporphyrinogen decarboxylase family protein [Kiritimatiella glycovorans]AKJ63704.1 hypothetical protein L21SP4_00424 [Kiritimatiella glycovorans]